MKNLQKTPKTLLKKIERKGQKLKAVSPVVATLILIIVAIVGAIAVGLIVSNISTSTSKQANVGNAQQGAQGTLLIGGSTTLYPITLAAQNTFQTQSHISLVISQGGSNAGMQGVLSGALDIGAASSVGAVSTAETFLLAQQALSPPQLQGVSLNPTLIGGSVIGIAENGQAGGGAFITDGANTCLQITDAALEAIYQIPGTTNTFGVLTGACAAAGFTGSGTHANTAENNALDLNGLCASALYTIPANLPYTNNGATVAQGSKLTGAETTLGVTAIPLCLGGATDTGPIFTPVSRLDSGGSEDAFASYIQYPNQAQCGCQFAGIQQTGNAGDTNYIKATKNTIGFADIGFLEGKATGVTCTAPGTACGVSIPEVVSNSALLYPVAFNAATATPAAGTNGYVTVTGSTAAIEGLAKAALKANQGVNPLTGTGAVPLYPDANAPGSGLQRNFYYVTNGAPAQLAQTFLTFITSPNAEAYFSSNGYYSLYDYTGA